VRERRWLTTEKGDGVIVTATKRESKDTLNREEKGMRVSLMGSGNGKKVHPSYYVDNSTGAPRTTLKGDVLRVFITISDACHTKGHP